DAVGLRAQADGSATEVRARRELEDGLGVALEHTHEAHATVGLPAVEVVADGQARPAGLERQRAVEVALRRGRAAVCGADGQRSTCEAANELGEERRAVGTRMAEPGRGRPGSRAR